MRESKGNYINLSKLREISSVSFKDFLEERESLIFEDSMEEKEVQARIKVQRAVLWLNVNRGFFAQLLSNLTIYGSSALDPPTMATNGYFIAYHPDFVLSQSDAAIRFVLCHEVLHCVGDHMSRRGNRDSTLWNWACDYAINPILNAEKDSNFDWPKDPNGERMGLYEQKYEGMRAEDIFELIKEDQELQDQLSKKKDGGNFGDVEDGDTDLPSADGEESLAQRGDVQEETGEQPPMGKQQPQQKRFDQEAKAGDIIKIKTGAHSGKYAKVLSIDSATKQMDLQELTAEDAFKELSNPK
jgi:hypothetical protein